jgi:hypothetical protein
MSHVALNYPHSSSGDSELSGDGRIFSKVRNSGWLFPTHFGPSTRRDHNGSFQGTTAIHAVIYIGGDLSHTSRPYV